ncbi:universal stress protein [Paeniglutamicibacter sp. NPDC091659]|uniref:universal stress protein n=1 Tax=Paeniglutamicibacter sp. NPDC091659 TaxID=3364389 RepID=UPI003803DC20
MSSNETDRRGPLIVGVIPNQHREVVAEAAMLAEDLNREIIFVFVEPNSYLGDWNLTVNLADRSLPSRDIKGQMSAHGLEILANLETLMVDSAASWTLRIVGGETWVALNRVASETHSSMFVVGTREARFGAHVSELLKGAVAPHLTSHQHRPVLVVPAVAKM